MSEAANGRAREYKVRDHLIDLGWSFIMRSAGSRGPADLAMAHPLFGLALIQVGKPGKTIGPDDRARFLRAAHVTGALPIEAIVHRGRITYRLVCDTPPRHWPILDMTDPMKETP